MAKKRLVSRRALAHIESWLADEALTDAAE
jgi:hypothetical protein